MQAAGQEERLVVPFPELLDAEVDRLEVDRLLVVGVGGREPDAPHAAILAPRRGQLPVAADGGVVVPRAPLIGIAVIDLPGADDPISVVVESGVEIVDGDEEDVRLLGG